MRWFKHETDARNSLKLRKVRRKYGADGYAIYWFCLEAIAYEVDKDNLTFELKEDAETIGFELGIQEKRVEEIMLYMIEIGLFESSRNTITCLKLAERLDKTMTNSPRMRKWLETKNVMTSDDNVMTLGDIGRHSATSGELDIEVEVEVDKKDLKEKYKKERQLDYSLWPELPSDQVFDDWCEMRKRMKANVTQTVVNTFGRELQKAFNSGVSVETCISECVTRNWRGFKADWILRGNLDGMSLAQRNMENFKA